MPPWIFWIVFDQLSRKYDLSYLPRRDHSLWTIHLVNRMWEEEQAPLCYPSQFVDERHISPLILLNIPAFISMRCCHMPYNLTSFRTSSAT